MKIDKKIIARRVVLIFLTVTLVSSAIAGFLGYFWTDVTTLKLQVKRITLAEKRKEEITVRIFASDGSLMYRKDYRMGGNIDFNDNLTDLKNMLNIMGVFVDGDLNRPQLSEKIFLKLENIDSSDMQDYVSAYYANNLTAHSNVDGYKKGMLYWYTVKRLKTLYTDRELYSLFMDSYIFPNKEFEVQGVKGAAKFYFDKKINDLTLLEKAFIISSMFSADSDKDRSANLDKNSRWLLTQLHEQGLISTEELRSNIDQKITFFTIDKGNGEPGYVAEVLRQVRQDTRFYPFAKSIDIYTHYNPSITSMARGVLKPLFESDKDIQASFVVVNLKERGVEAAIGSRVPTTNTNRAFTLQRQIGSIFKPIVYLTAFENGYNPAMMVMDRRHIFYNDGSLYTPNNYAGVYMGNVTLRTGLVHSLNNATVYLANRLGVQSIRRTALKMGFQGEMGSYLSLSLGTFPTTAIGVAELFSTLANYGVKAKPTVIDRIVIVDDDRSIDTKPKPIRVADERSSFQVLFIMQDVVKSGTAKGAGMLPGTASKTGTTDQSRDLWTVAVSGDYLFVLWIGYDSNKPLGEERAGGNTAAPIIAEFQRLFFPVDTTFTLRVPKGILFENVRQSTGMITQSTGKGIYLEAFKDDNLPPREPLAKNKK